MKCFGVVPRLFACIRHVDFRGCCATFTYAHASTTSKPISSIIIFCTTSCFPCSCYRRSRCSNTLTPSLLSIFDFSMDSWGVFQKFSVSCGSRLFLRGSFATSTSSISRRTDTSVVCSLISLVKFPLESPLTPSRHCGTLTFVRCSQILSKTRFWRSTCGTATFMILSHPFSQVFSCATTCATWT